MSQEVTTGGSDGSRHLALKLVLSVAVAGFFVWLMREGAMPVLPGKDAFSRLKWWVIPAHLGLWCVVHVLRAARWQFLLLPLGRVPMRRVLECSFLGFFAILVLPLRTGEVVRPVLIRRDSKISGWAALGTIGAERIVDGLLLSVMLVVSLQLSPVLDPLPDRLGELPLPVSVIPGAAYAFTLVFAAAMLCMAAFFVYKRAARRLVEASVGLVSKRLGHWLADRVERVSQGLRFLSNPRHGVPFALVTTVYWLLNGACTWLLGWGVGFEEFGYFEACAVTGVLALGILVPNAPGFFGSFQFSLYAGLALFRPHEEIVTLGAALVLLTYLSQVGVTLAFAGWASLSSGVAVWRVHQQRAAEE